MKALLAGAMLAAAALAAGCSHRDPHWVDPEPAPPIAGVDVTSAKPFRLADQRGHVVLLSFGYTSCMEVCPDTFAKAKAVFRDLGDASRDLSFVYVTVDPERDKPEPFGAFMRSVDPRFEGVFLEGDALSSVLADYHVVVRKRLPDPSRYAKRDVDPSKFYAMDHTSGFWGIDRKGELRFRYSHDVTDAELREATRQLLEEPR